MVATTKSGQSLSAAHGSSDLYDLDYVSWIDRQVTLLRAGRLTEIDAENVAEELSDLGKVQFYRLQGSLKILVMHMLKWDQQSEHRSASWEGTIREHRRRIRRLVDKNPGLKPRLPEALAESYEDARGWASIETGIPDDDFPAECPYVWSDVMDRVFAMDRKL
ncbi:DUF29 domain-containing protein [uncultured Enterovirga sp.]|uniref:DUF29 domain-containing protein n=1 Tax=uncultured Enterovirga sp. TaxID=2026352 RepID=UPI0035C9BFA1